MIAIGVNSRKLIKFIIGIYICYIKLQFLPLDIPFFYDVNTNDISLSVLTSNEKNSQAVASALALI